MFNNATLETTTGDYTLITQRPIVTAKTYGEIFVESVTPSAYSVDSKIEYGIPKSGQRVRKLVQIVLSDTVVDPLNKDDDVIVNFTVSHKDGCNIAKIEEAISLAKAAYSLPNFSTKVAKGINS